MFLLFAIAGKIYGTGQDSTARLAFQLCDSGDYEGAESWFAALVKSNPEVSMLNYYYGACLTENGTFSEKALNLLLRAQQEEIPARLDYYLGLQYHAKEDWDQALRYYNRFKMNGSPEEKEKYLLQDKIQQCFDRINPFTFIKEVAESDTLNSDPFIQKSRTDSVGAIKDHAGNLTIMADQDIHPTTDTTFSAGQNETELPDSGKNNNQMHEPMFVFILNDMLIYYQTDHFRTAEGKSAFLEGQKKQHELDETLQQTERLRKVYSATVSQEVKTNTGNKIVEMENDSYALTEEIDRYFSLARSSEEQYWKNAAADEKQAFIAETEKYHEQKGNDQVKTEEKDSLLTAVILPETEALITEPVVGPVVPETPLKDDLMYKIQIGAYRNSPPSYIKRLFQKLSLIRKIDQYTDETGVVVYTTGNLTTFDDAVILQKQVRLEGVKDAFVVSYYNGKRIPLEEAKKLEKEK